jgi:hypothetical protein
MTGLLDGAERVLEIGKATAGRAVRTSSWWEGPGAPRWKGCLEVGRKLIKGFDIVLNALGKR